MRSRLPSLISMAEDAEPVRIPITGELDLHTFHPAEAASVTEEYLAACRARGLTSVRIIHGKGTGKLRQEVRAALKGHPQVTSFEEGHPSEGGDGVTVAKMVKE